VASAELAGQYPASVRAIDGQCSGSILITSG